MGLGTRGRWDVEQGDVGTRGRGDAGTWDAGPPERGTRGLGDVGTWWGRGDVGLENVGTRDVERRYSRT